MSQANLIGTATNHQYFPSILGLFSVMSAFILKRCKTGNEDYAWRFMKVILSLVTVIHDKNN